MDEKLLKFQVGIVVLAALAAALILIMLLGAWPTIFESYYTVYADFPEAPGVARDTPV
ncbi:MAG TPA: mammalian cell entry protein, partial [Planctomycetaceae bacterium]|nr:mammalian cell entry protein [Planctomycetaceae bacterium]